MARRPVHGQLSAFAAALATRHPGTLAVLAYGSALRDSNPGETLVDFYLLVDTAEHLGGNALLRWLGEKVPPNVYYAEHTQAGVTLRSKYAVMTLERFTACASAATANPYIWARFTQPARLVWLRGEDLRSELVDALATSARTAYRHGLFLSATTPWQSLFANTYRTELRPEGADRAAQIVAADADYYAALERMLQGATPIASSWAAKRIFGKLWSVARLAKAAFTFQGGADYAAWKIARHSGVKIEVTDWQRRHPFLAGLLMLPRLLGRKGLK